MLVANWDYCFIDKVFTRLFDHERSAFNASSQDAIRRAKDSEDLEALRKALKMPVYELTALEAQSLV